MALNPNEEQLWQQAIEDVADTPAQKALADSRLRRFADFLNKHDGSQQYDDPEVLDHLMDIYGLGSHEVMALIETASILAGERDQYE